MKNKDIEKIIKTNFDNETPEVLSKILKKCNGKELKIMKKEKKNNFFKDFLPVASLAVVALVLGIFVFNNQTNSLKSTVMFDVNPSVEIQVNKKDTITSAKALNVDGKKILEDMDLKGSKLNIGVNAIVGSMYKNGYIDELKNSILVTVDSKDKDHAASLEVRITKEIKKSLKTYNIDSAILSQIYDLDDEIERKAREYGISEGKAELLEKIIESNLTNKNGTKYKFEELVDLSINELNVILNSKNKKVNNVTSSGNASTKSYIGVEKAKQIAFNAAGVNANNIYDLEVELDYDYRTMIYEISFNANGREYEYEINAINGSIINGEKELDDDYYPATNNLYNSTRNTTNNSAKSNTTNTNKNTSTSYISRDRAKQIALGNAGISNVRDLSIEFDREGGKTIYEVSFESGNKDYEYDIDAVTGSILNKKIEVDD